MATEQNRNVQYFVDESGNRLSSPILLLWLPNAKIVVIAKPQQLNLLRINLSIQHLATRTWLLSRHNPPCRIHTSVSLRPGLHILLLYKAAPYLAGPSANGCDRLPFVTREIVLQYLRQHSSPRLDREALGSTWEYPPLTFSIGGCGLRTVRKLVSSLSR